MVFWYEIPNAKTESWLPLETFYAYMHRRGSKETLIDLSVNMQKAAKSQQCFECTKHTVSRLVSGTRKASSKIAIVNSTEFTWILVLFRIHLGSSRWKDLESFGSLLPSDDSSVSLARQRHNLILSVCPGLLMLYFSTTYSILVIAWANTYIYMPLIENLFERSGVMMAGHSSLKSRMLGLRRVHVHAQNHKLATFA